VKVEAEEHEPEAKAKKGSAKEGRLRRRGRREEVFEEE